MGVEDATGVSVAEADELYRWDREHVIHPQFVPDEKSRTRIMVRGSGYRLQDSEGRSYLDATGGLWCAQIGHGRSELADVAQEQMRQLEFFASFWDFSDEPSIRLAHKLMELAPDHMGGVYYALGGSEGNEIAFMLARMFHARAGHPDRKIILSRHSAYHGITYASRAATGLDAFHAEIGPLPTGFASLAPHPYRVEDCTETCVAELEAVIEEVGAENIAAMIGEPIMGVGGMVVPPEDYWPRMEAVLREHGILLIFDEVVTAYGRIGHSWFAAEHFGVKPDIIVTAKGITSGYLPLGAVLASRDVRDAALQDPGFVSGFTSTGHPTCAPSRCATSS